MVNFSVFNELSLPFPNNKDIEDKFTIFFRLLKELKNKNLTTIRVDEDFKNYRILEDKTFQEFFGQIRDKDFQRKMKHFIANTIISIDTPIIKDEDLEDDETLIENTYIFDTELTFGGLACADVWNTIAISFDSDAKWDSRLIKLTKNASAEIEVRHSSKTIHLQCHTDFFEELEKELKLCITKDSFWENRDEYFSSKIIFCEEVKKQIEKVDLRIFNKAISMLRDIETEKKKLSDFNISREGETVRDNPKLKSLREFYINGTKLFFEKHIKNLPNNGRIHYIEKEDKIYIGYIGEHLPTKNF